MIVKKVSSWVRIREKIRSDKGSMVLDAALVIPLLIFICYFMLSAMLTVQNELVMRYALDQTAKELSLLVPLADAVVEGVRSPELDALISDITGGEQALKEAVGDLASSVFLQNFIQNKVEKWLQAGSKKLGIKQAPDERQVILSMISDHALEMAMNYHVYTPWTKTDRVAYSHVPLWTKYDQAYQGEKKNADKDENKEEDGIWSEHNFTRGKYFREKYGANLPFNYPVISKFKNGQAFAIRSMDLTAPVYQSADYLEQELMGEITRLAAFEGSSRQTKIDPPVIKSGDIKSRQLTIVVPANSDYDLASGFFANLKRKADDLGVSLNFAIRGNSYRYKDKDVQDK